MNKKILEYVSADWSYNESIDPRMSKQQIEPS